MKLFLTSVVNDCLENIESFKEIINSQTNLVILPFSYHKDYIGCSEDIINKFNRDAVEEEGSIYWKTVAPFINAGINPDRISVINQFSDNRNFIEYKLTRDNTVVYLPGGYPENIVEYVYKLGLYDVLKECEIIVGESAGSMCVSNNYFVYKDADYDEYNKYKGLFLINKATVIPHYSSENRDILIACSKFNRKHPRTRIYCVEDGGYVVYNNGKLVEAHKTYIYKRRKRFRLI